MSNEAPEQQRNRRSAAPIRTQQPQDRPAPPLLVDGVEAVRDPHC